MMAFDDLEKLQSLLSQEFELQVLQSRAGYYIGTATPEGLPMSRDSAEYWRTEREAQQALEADDWTQRPDP